jgi:hypothetical protein
MLDKYRSIALLFDMLVYLEIGDTAYSANSSHITDYFNKFDYKTSRYRKCLNQTKS